MKLLKTSLLIIFIFISKVSIAQTTLGEIMKNEITPIDSIVKSCVSEWTNAVSFFLTSNRKKHSRFNNKEEISNQMDYMSKEYNHKESFKSFMCNDDDDDTYARYSTGKKRNILPIITLTFTDMKSGKSSVVKKNIRNLQKFLVKTNYNINHIDVENVQAYLVDEAKKKEGADIGRFVYYSEHIFSIAEYKVRNGIYEMVNLQNDSFYINRGKSYWGQNRNEEALLKKDNIVVILGDASITIYYK